MDPIEILLRLVGAFYAFAGLVATRVALTSHFLDSAIAAITLKRTAAVERRRFLWLLGMATLVLASGACLMLLLDASPWLFLAAALAQAAYIFVLAPHYFDAAEALPEGGRRHTTNAFVIYGAATAFVLWAAFTGRLHGWRDVPWPLLALLGAAMLAHAVHLARTLASSPRRPSLFDGPSEDADAPEPWTSKRIKVMADYDCHPLWALDENCYGDFPPEKLGLSAALTRDLNAWADAFTASLNRDDPADSRWTEAQHRAHETEARPLALRLARERPDLMVYVMDREVGIVEVHAEEGE